MKPHFAGFAVAALLMIGSTLPSLADDEAAPAASSTPTATPAEAPPPSVPRPSIVPKTAEPAPAPVAAETPPQHRRTAHRHWHRYGVYRAAYWEPFPIFWPHLYHNQIHWNRVPWRIHF